MSNKVSAVKFSQFILYSRGQVLPSAQRYQSVNIGQEKFKVQRSNIDVRSDKIYSLRSLSSLLSYTTTLVELCQARRPTEVRETVSRTERSLVIWSLITSQSGPEEIISCHITVSPGRPQHIWNSLEFFIHHVFCWTRGHRSPLPRWITIWEYQSESSMQ